MTVPSSFSSTVIVDLSSMGARLDLQALKRKDFSPVRCPQLDLLLHLPDVDQLARDVPMAMRWFAFPIHIDHGIPASSSTGSLLKTTVPCPVNFPSDHDNIHGAARLVKRFMPNSQHAT